MRKFMKWVKVEGEAYYPAFKCSNCETVIVVEDECFELPCYCKNCEAVCDGEDF